jgi:hypothetical protein
VPVSAQQAVASGVPASSAMYTAASGVPAATPSDENDWKGDRIQLLTDVKDIKDMEGNASYFAPDGAVFIVSNDDKSNRITGKFVNVKPCNGDGTKSTKVCIDPTEGLPAISQFFAWIGVKHINNKESDKARDVPAKLIPVENRCPNTSALYTPVENHGLYVLDKAAVEKMPHSRYGWTMGGLIVPFKYQTSDKSFSGSTSIGPYVGYRFQSNSGSVTPVISAGWVSNIPVSTGTGTQTTSASGFSWSAGVIFSVDKGSRIQFGVLAGQDRVGSSAPNPYKYEGDTWLSMAIGYKVF